MRALLLLALTSCVSSNRVECDNGTICPEGFTCSGDDRCLAPGAEEECANKVEGDACAILGADGTCREGACLPNFCGDGVLEGAELCDGDQFAIDPQRGAPYDCRSFGAYAAVNGAGDGLHCNRALCTLDPSVCLDDDNGPPHCGDHVVNGPEVCDSNAQTTCLALGFDAGSVICGLNCNFSIANCSKFGFAAESLDNVVGLAVTGTSHADQWAVGLKGKIAHYDGTFWTAIKAADQPTTKDLIGVWSIATDDVWAIGNQAAVLHYDGTAWSNVANVPVGDYVDLWAASATEVYIASRDAGVFEFDGQSWTTLPAVPGTPFSMRGTTDASGTQLWVATVEGPLQRFDSGAWSPLSPPDTVVKFTDPNARNDVWAIGHHIDAIGNFEPGNGIIAHFDGAAWTTTERDGEIFNNVAASAPNDAWIAGVDGLMRHFDGVAFSNSLNIGLGSGVTGISGFINLGSDEVVAVSTLRNSFRYRGQTFGQFKTLGGDPFSGLDNNAFFTFAGDDAWIVGENRDALHFDGTDWTVKTSFASPARSMFGFAPNDIYFGLADGHVVHHTGGSTFITENVATVEVSHLFGSAGDIWAFSVGNAFHRNAQNDWTAFPLAIGAEVRSVSGNSPTDIWAITEKQIPQQENPPFIESRIFHWNGTAWTEVPSNSTVPLLAVAATPTAIHVSAKDGHMLVSSDGLTFSELTQVGTIDQLTMMYATAPDDVIAASKTEAFHFDGAVWSPLRVPDDIHKPGFPGIKGIQATAGRIDFFLQRFAIMTLIRTRALACRNSELDLCNDGVDNDCDGVLDSQDSDCP